MMGLGTDNASVMTGINNGVYKILKNDIPNLSFLSDALATLYNLLYLTLQNIRYQEILNSSFSIGLPTLQNVKMNIMKFTKLLIAVKHL